MFPEAVTAAVNAFADFLLRYAVALATVGALSMALIEAWKKIFDTRTKYHLRMVLGWIPAPAAYAELIHLTTGTRLHDPEGSLVLKHRALEQRFLPLPPEFELSLYTLELERMMGHIQEAADQVLRDPSRYQGLYRFLTDGASPADVDAWQAKAYEAGTDVDGSAARAYANERAALYARLHGAAKRRLDGFQLYTGFRWANLNQFTANLVGALVLFVALATIYRAAEGNALTIEELGLILAFSVFGGVLAPIAKDLVVALKRVRSGG